MFHKKYVVHLIFPVGFLDFGKMLINNANNDQNIDRARPKMSDSLSGQNHNAKLLSGSEKVNYFNETNINSAVGADDLNRSYDHMYATNAGNNGDLNVINYQSAESEVKFLKDWLLLHLDLIQQQNDEILNKEKTILFLQQENEMVRCRFFYF